MSIHYESATIAPSKSEAMVKTYSVGFVVSLVLTLTAFAFVDKHLLSTTALYIVVAALAFIQAFIHLRFFLRNNLSQEDSKWNTISFLFTILVMVVLISGSLWIMYNLNYNMVH